ncbi:tripartite tricarboxylate transporter TctB family protein [Primorskyibacter sp. S187A]|uniref:tripartite tricarboxylate transporter TctB family protein n=1 Tax=Primorskyibacter sp. S187A TaxID=3415130 RepID=UPI003C7BAADA
MTAETNNETLRPGERVFALLLVLVSGFVFSEAFAISGFRGLTTGGVMPMVASSVMMVSATLILAQTFGKPAAPYGLSGLATFLFPLRVLPFAGLVALYAFAIGPVGFLPASAGFLFVAIWMLWRRGPLWSALISLGSIILIYALFRVVFQVVLPAGELWR